MVQGIESISLELEVDPLGDDERLGEGQVHLLERGELNLSNAGISEGIARSRCPRGLVEPLSLVTGQGEAVSLGVAVGRQVRMQNRVPPDDSFAMAMQDFRDAAVEIRVKAFVVLQIVLSDK